MPESTLMQSMLLTGIGIFATIVVALVIIYAQLRAKRLELDEEKRKTEAAQRLAYFAPFVRLCYELDARIGRIFDHLSDDWLNRTHLASVRDGKGFAESPLQTGYFLMSSVYVFACFFGWTEAIARGVDATEQARAGHRVHGKWIAWALRRNGHRRSRVPVYFFDQDISIVRRLFQYEELFENYVRSRQFSTPRDACKLHRHFQHSIGEMMLRTDGAGMTRCKTFREFFEEYRGGEQFRYWFIPLEELFADLSGFPQGKDLETQAEMKNDLRPLRLLAIRYWCRKLMQSLATDLGISPPDPDEVVTGRSDELQGIIRSVTIEELESHLAGLRKEH